VNGGFWSSIPAPVWNWGPAIIILIGIFILALYGGRGFSRLIGPVMEKFIAAQERQADAMAKQAESMTHLAVCIEGQAEKTAFQNERVMVSLECLHKEYAAFRVELGGLIGEVKAMHNERVSDGA
jgi:hypothetical protein